MELPAEFWNGLKKVEELLAEIELPRSGFPIGLPDGWLSDLKAALIVPGEILVKLDYEPDPAPPPPGEEMWNRKIRVIRRGDDARLQSGLGDVVANLVRAILEKRPPTGEEIARTRRGLSNLWPFQPKGRHAEHEPLSLSAVADPKAKAVPATATGPLTPRDIAGLLGLDYEACRARLRRWGRGNPSKVIEVGESRGSRTAKYLYRIEDVRAELEGCPPAREPSGTSSSERPAKKK